MFHYRTVRIAAFISLLSTSALPQTGYAASYLDTIPRGAPTVYTASLADLTHAEKSLTTRTLDWQRPSIELYFDLPPAERTSEIVLTLSADPLTTVARNAPLQIQFNNAKPVPVVSNGRGFEARLPFDTAQSRTRRNTIRITYPVPEGHDCVAPAHGAWSIDLAASTIRMKGRALRRHMSLTEVSEYLSQPGLSPQKVGLIASGPEATDMQALAAQGVALRTPDIPAFSVNSRGNDFNVIMVKRSQLSSVTDEPMILNSKGARIYVPRGRPTELIFTADTDAEIVQMLKVFTIRRFPNTSRPITSLGEIDLQSRLGSDTVKIDGKTALMDLAVASDIAAGAQSYRFGVEDPVATSGEILLKLSSMNNLSEKSRLRVALNGKVLGAAKLDKKRKSVAFPVTQGSLNATSNVLNIVPDLDALTGYECPSPESLRPSFSIGDSSRLTLKQSTPSPVTELSKLTSTGSLFANYESYISLPKNTRDYQASLRVLARLAKSTGYGITLADYTRSPNIPADQHRLFIGPSAMVKPVLSGAPQALRAAMSGQSITGDNLLQANFERFASAGSLQDIVQQAAAQAAPRKISRGGIAALYEAGNGKLTGVISSAPGQSFVQSSQSLVKLSHWNALQGGVSRWTSSSVVMSQTAQSDANIRLPRSDKRFELPELGIASVDFREFSLADIDIGWPDFEMPQVSLPEFNLPKFDWPEFNRPSFDFRAAEEDMGNSREASMPAVEQIAEAAPARAVNIPNILPRVKPTSKVQGDSKLSLRGPFQFEAVKEKPFGSFDAFRRDAKSKWFGTKRWVKTKTHDIQNTQTLDNVARATDRFQDRVQPAGSSMKASLRDKLPGKGLVQLGDRQVSAFGLLLIMASVFVLLLMSLAKPSSRLGGRH